MLGGLVSGVTALAASSNFEDYTPKINEFLPPEILFQGTPFAMNRIIFVRVLATIIMLLVLGITAARAKLVPGRWQGAVEWVIEFVKNSIVYQVMGEVRGKRYVPMVTTVFLTLLVFNLCGEVPGFNIAASATITLPLLFAAWCFVQYWIAGIREKGLGRYLRDELFPRGVPWPLYILLCPIQLFELLVIRPVSLTIRLFANMVSGHLILSLCLGATQYFFFAVVNKLMMPLGILTFAGGMFMYLFETLVAALQAYIFAILTTAYINMSYPEID
ncbi:MAG: F0F1 ATP synthase subunit A [Bifidobacterium sp.]|nr:F0F1 ATP synthase subunit A [Bifidobacterium sp.]